MKFRNYVGAFLVFYAINLVHPVTPTFLKEAGLDSKYFGFLFAAMSLGMALTSPIWGKLGDRYGRRSLLFVGIVGYATGQLIFISTDLLHIMLIGRFIAGSMVGGATVNLYAYVTEHTSNKNRTKSLAFIGALSTIALSVGYQTGGFFGEQFGVRETAYIQFAVCLLTGIVLYLGFTKVVEKTTSKKETSIVENFKLILKADSKNLLVMLVISFFITFSFVSAPKYIDLLFVELGYTSKDLGDFVFVTGIVSLAVTFLLVYPLSKIYSEVVLIGVTVFFAGLTMVLAFATGMDFLVAMYVMWNLHVVFKTFHEPLDIAYISKASDLDKGVLMGIRNTIRSIAQVVGPILCGFIYANNKYNVFYLCGIILMLAGLFTFTLLNRKRG